MVGPKLHQAYVLASEGLARYSIFRPKMHKMSFGVRAPPGPAGGVYSVPPDSLAALKLLAPSAFGGKAFRFFFFSHSNTVCF